MLEQPGCLRLHELCDHITKDGPNGIEALIGGTYVSKPIVVEQNLLDDKDGNRLAKLGASLHDPQAEGDNLRRQKEVDDLRRIVLDQRTNNSQTRKAEVLERSGLGGRVQERVEEERNVSCRVRVSLFVVPETTREGSALPCRNRVRVSLCDATHCNRASALHTLFEAAAVN